MTLQELHHKLQFLEFQRTQLGNEILETKKQIEQLSPFTKELTNLKNIGQNYTDEVLLPMVQNELQKITDLKFEIISQDEMTLYIHYL